MIFNKINKIEDGTGSESYPISDGVDTEQESAGDE